MEYQKDVLKEQVEIFKKQFFDQNKKNIFLKNKQKLEIAQKISESFNLNDLIKKTCFIIPNTNKIFIDYTVFKLYANTNNYSIILNHIISLYIDCIQVYKVFEVHVNLKSLTPSATEKYKTCIEMFNSMTSNSVISPYLTNWYIYNPPSMIEIVKRILICVLDPTILSKVIIYPKSESNIKMNNLLSYNNEYDSSEEEN
jgi:hypothetical protein